MYRKSTPPAPVPQPRPGELLVPVGIDALARQLRKAGWREFGQHPAHVSLTGHRGWLMVIGGRNALFIHPRFRIRLAPEGPGSTRVWFSDPEPNPFALAIAAMPGVVALLVALAATLGRLESAGDVALSLTYGLGLSFFFFGLATLGRRFFGDKHSIVAREHVLEQARVVAANAMPRVRVADEIESVVDDAEGVSPRRASANASARRR